MAILASAEIENSTWKKIGIFWAVLSILFWGVISLYLGSTFDPGYYQDQIKIYVVNMDSTGGIVGQTFQNVVKDRVNGISSSLKSIPIDTLGNVGVNDVKWTVFDPINYGGNVNKVNEEVALGDVWGAIVVNPGASDKLIQAAATGDPEYDPRKALSIIYDEGRNPTTVANFVLRPMRTLCSDFVAEFQNVWIKQLAAASGNNGIAAIATKAPIVISTPASWTETNIAKSSSYVAYAGLTIGLMLLIIFTFAATTIIIDLTDEYSLELAASTMISLRLRAALSYCLGMSFFYAIAMAAFKGKFTAATWFGFWLLHFLHLGVHVLTFLISSVVASAAVQAPLFLFFFVVNITAGLGTPELSHPFYIWTYAMPMYAAVTGSRSLMFGGYPRLGLNFGALIGWFLFLLLVYIFFQVRMQDDADFVSSSPQRNSTIQDLEKSLSGTLRASRHSFSYRENEDEGMARAQRRMSQASFGRSRSRERREEDEFRGISTADQIYNQRRRDMDVEEDYHHQRRRSRDLE